MAQIQAVSCQDPKSGLSRLLVVIATARMGHLVRRIVMVRYLAVAAALSWCYSSPGKPPIQTIDPPEKDFFAKSLSYQGIPIKAPKEVVDEALFAAYERLDTLLSNQPTVISNLVSARAELHIIGRDQVTSDLPEHQHLKGKKLEQYHGLTVDERTRGLGGLLTSCGEENLLKLEKDRYKGRDICVHEFAHNIRQHGIPRDIRKRFDEQYRKSLDKGLWEKSYAASNPDEFFAELTMWYFGTHGDLHMTGTKPENGRDGLKKYDPEAFELLDEFYSGRMQIPKMQPKLLESKIAN
jgi:alpha-glucosidase